ncbi:MAG: hypothetical protein HC908_06305 [Calothrix sp. SM1_7_51]|nr:hypothetical protein [Calothrix sp. SM1_7_51]
MTQAENLLQIGTVGFNPAINPTNTDTTQPTTSANSSRIGILGNRTNQNQVATVSPLQAAINSTLSQNQAVSLNQNNQNNQNNFSLQQQPFATTNSVNNINGMIIPQANNIPQQIQTINSNNFVNQTLVPSTVLTPQTQPVNTGVAYPQASTVNSLPLNPYNNPTLPTVLSPVPVTSNVNSTIPVVTNPYAYQTQPSTTPTVPNPGLPNNYVNPVPQQPMLRQQY